ncbi:hypothetical protein NDU88_006313 [Pleurodeles waltl]|uniref:Uncharacterized protein n=1 Tax=Pleurodeles waltl TaxID=8319 RepID=A0AAV7PIG4_PLEWA|nr:hypothetical protein NDU88_006313 [Pleurodeles waltl]
MLARKEVADHNKKSSRGETGAPLGGGGTRAASQLGTSWEPAFMIDMTAAKRARTLGAARRWAQHRIMPEDFSPEGAWESWWRDLIPGRDNQRGHCRLRKGLGPWLRVPHQPCPPSSLVGVSGRALELAGRPLAPHERSVKHGGKTPDSLVGS